MVFSSHRRLQTRTGKSGTPRDTYIKRLVEEFHITKSKDCKEQVLANLANFSYDPINYAHLRNCGAIDLFLTQLQSTENPILTGFALAGISNLVPDPTNKKALLDRKIIPAVTTCLQSDKIKDVSSALSILFYLADKDTKNLIAKEENIRILKQLSESETTEVRNLAVIVLGEIA